MKKKIKIRIILAILGTIANIFLVNLIDLVFKGNFKDLNVLYNFSFLFQTFKKGMPLQMFFVFEVSLILLLLISLLNNKKYKSKLIKITNEIEIPEAIGQNQFGSAKFMSEKQMEKYFACISADEIRHLLKRGDKN